VEPGRTQKLFGTDGVRGLANEEPITPSAVVRLVESAACVLAPESSKKTVVVGRDTRASGELLEAAVASGLAGFGLDVYLAGIVPTPAVAYLTKELKAAFGVVISASHNPFADNGIKFFSSTGYKLTDAQESQIEQLFFQPPTGVSRLVGRQVGRVRPLPEAEERYAAFVASTLPEGVSLQGKSIALDLAHGAAYRLAPMVLERFGADLKVDAASPDGFNINDECGSNNPQRLSAFVKKTSAGIGIAHDGDADRVLFCDETGDPLDGDEILAIIAAELLQTNRLRQRTLVATVMSNYGLDRFVQELGGKVHRTAVGDRYVIDALVERDLNFGGEQSGHIIFRDCTTTGDGLIAALQMLGIWASSGKRLSELRKVLQKYPQVQRNILVREKIPFTSFPGIIALVSQAERELNGSGRVLLRYSGTEPKARLLLEGPQQTVLEQLADAIERTVQQYLGM
jgi:phosphoglucosamine mutase